MKKLPVLLSFILLLPCTAAMAGDTAIHGPSETGVDLADAIRNRRSIRKFADRKVSPGDLSAVLWAAWGQTAPDGRRTVPTPWNRRMIRIYVMDSDGCSLYDGEKNKLKRLCREDLRPRITVFTSSWVTTAPVLLVITADMDQGPFHTGNEEKMQNSAICAGACAQNVYLMAGAKKMGTCIVADFDRKELQKILKLKKDEPPFFIMPLGYTK